MNSEFEEKLSPEIFELYEDYAHGKIGRRDFLQRASLLVAGGIAVESLLERLSPNYALGIQVQTDDERILTETVSYQSPQGGGEIKGLLVKPKEGTEPLPSVLVIHENRGLNPHIEDVARRLGVAGFLALAPDALSPLGGYPGNDDDGRRMQAERTADQMRQDFN